MEAGKGGGGAAAPPVSGLLPRTPSCRCCAHADRAKIERAILEGVSNRTVAERFGISHQSVWRHKRNCIPTPVQFAAIEAREAEQGGHALDLLESADGLRVEALRVLREAQAAGERDTELRAIREAARLLDLMGKLRGEISNDTTVNVLVAPAMQAVQSVILNALAPYGEARRAVAIALANMGEPLAIEHEP